MEAHGSAAGFLALVIFLLQLADGQMTIGEGTSDPPVHNMSSDHIQPIPAVGRSRLPSSTTTDPTFVTTTPRAKEHVPEVPTTTRTSSTTPGPPDTDKGGGTRAEVPVVPSSASTKKPLIYDTKETENEENRTGHSKKPASNKTIGNSKNTGDIAIPDTKTDTRPADTETDADSKFNNAENIGNVHIQNENISTGNIQNSQNLTRNSSEAQILCSDSSNSSCVLCIGNNSTNCSSVNSTIDTIDSDYSDSSNLTYLEPYAPYYGDGEEKGQYEHYYKDGEDNLENSIKGDDDGRFDMDYYYDDDYIDESKENISNGSYDIGDEDYYQQPSEDQWIRDRGQPSSIEGSELFYGPHGFEAQIGPLEELKLSRHEPVEIHPSYLDATSHDASLSILVFYTWIGVVIVMVIGAFIALKHRHRVTAIATYVWESRSAYRKETVFATEEGRNLLTHQQV